MDSILHNFTNNLKRVLVQAAQLAVTQGSKKIEPTHLFYGLTNQVEHIVISGATKKTSPKKNVKVPKKMSSMTLSPMSRKIILEAAALAEHYNHSHIGTEHLFASLLDSRNAKIQAIIKNNHLDARKIKSQLTTILKTSSKIADILDSLLPSSAVTEEHVDEHISPSAKNRKVTALEFFSVHLTDPHHAQKLDPLIGRSNEIDRLMRVLARRTKNNPVLLGHPGVGKTAIVEGLAQRIIAGSVPEALQNKRIYSLNLTALIAGSAFRGELEMRFKQILDEVKQDPDLILFIDEIHNLVGAGSSNGSMDAGNIVKPALARGELRCIGATTFQEYKKYIEEDPALERRFQSITVGQPSIDEAKEILSGLASTYEKFHHVTITPEAINAAVIFSDRYIPEKFLPDKAIDILDEAAAKLRIDLSNTELRRSIAKTKNDIEVLAAQKEEALYNLNDLEMAQTIHQQEAYLKSLLNGLEKTQETQAVTHAVITPEHIAEIVASMTGIPVKSLLHDERERLLTLESHLSQKVIGQAHAKNIVSDFIRRAKSGLLQKGRPMASFAFLGPSGVGKTEMAKVLADEIFGPEGLIKLDMSEFAESFSVSRLIGAPSGYIGYKEGGKLTEAVRQRPHSLILLDEIEKAHPRVAQVLLQILEDGCLTDAAGKKVDFSNTMIILTSNIGAQRLMRGNALGFARDEQETVVSAKDSVVRELRDIFNPELINRLDQIIMFDPLTRENIEEIADLKLNQLKNNLAEQGMTLSWTQKARAVLVTRAHDPQEGARKIRHIMESSIENAIAHIILSNPSKSGILTIDVQKDTFVCKIKQAKNLVSKENTILTETSIVESNA